MKINFKQFPAELQELIQTNNSLKQALDRLEKGTSSTPRSRFYETKEPSWILDSIVSKLNGSVEWKDIADRDLSKSDKFTAQGGSAPLKDRLEGFEEYFLHLGTPTIVSDPLWRKAKAIATRRLKFNKSGRPISAEEVVAYGVKNDKYNTNSGYPLYSKRSSKEAIEHTLHTCDSAIKNKFPTTLGTRASMGKTGVKARSIFMGSMAVNVWGQRFQMPLQNYIRSLKLDFFSPWEGQTVTQAVISQAWTVDCLKFGTDYSKMDQHFNKHHAFEVFDVVKHFFNKQYWGSLWETLEYVFTMPIITNLGYIEQEHAMPSGSEWTNFLETVWDYILSIYLELKYSIRIILKCGIGDDQLYLIKSVEPFISKSQWTDNAIKWITEVFVTAFEDGGTPGNKEKQEVSLSYTTFLQRYHSNTWKGLNGDINAAGVYSLIRNVTSQVYPEFYFNTKLWDKYMFAIRVIQIAENCIYHPLFRWYVQEFIANANENIMEFVRLKDDEINKQDLISRKIANFIPTYTQEKKDKPLIEFETFKLLREIA